MIVQSFGTLQTVAASEPNIIGRSVRLYDRRQAYGDIYRTQPNVRICVDFLSRNVAQLAPHVFRRVSDTDRVRLADHQLATWLANPNPATRRYRLMESLMSDLGIYFEAYWLKVRTVTGDNRPRIGLVRLPPEQMDVEGGLLPSAFVWTVQGRQREFAPSEVIYFNGYNPCNPLRGLSPMETLSRILAEEAAAGEHREAYWRNSSKQEGVIERATDSPSARWSPHQKQEWREQYQERYAGAEGTGQVVVLEPGMTFKPASWSAKDSEFVAGGKLRREVCAAAYHIPQPMVGILDHATFSNIREQHKHTYQDTLAPWLEMIQQEIEGQLLVECDDRTNVYIEFNIAAKLQGTFEDRASALQTSVGRAWRTVNEARALENLPRIDDPEFDRVAPQQGGPSDASAQPRQDAPPAPDPADDGADAEDQGRAVAAVLQATRDRQQARLGKLPVTDRPAAFTADLDRWTRELAHDLAGVTGADETGRAAEVNAATLRQLEADAVEARVRALEQARTRTAIERSYIRNPTNGLIEKHIDRPIEEPA